MAYMAHDAIEILQVVLVLSETGKADDTSP